MQELTFEDLVDATMRLEPELRHVLVQLLHTTPPLAAEESFMQAEALNEAGAYSVSAPLPADHPHGVDASDADLLAAVQCLSCEWEDEPA